MSKNRNNSKIFGQREVPISSTNEWIVPKIKNLEIGHLGALNNLFRVNLKIFRKKGDKLSHIIHIVELDELFPKNGVWPRPSETSKPLVGYNANDFREQLVEFYKMYHSLFFENFWNLPKLFRAPISMLPHLVNNMIVNLMTNIVLFW